MFRHLSSPKVGPIFCSDNQYNNAFFRAAYSLCYSAYVVNCGAVFSVCVSFNKGFSSIRVFLVALYDNLRVNLHRLGFLQPNHCACPRRKSERQEGTPRRTHCGSSFRFHVHKTPGLPGRKLGLLLLHTQQFQRGAVWGRHHSRQLIQSKCNAVIHWAAASR